MSGQAGSTASTTAVCAVPDARHPDSTQYTSSQQSQLDPIIYLIYALLSMSVVSGLFRDREALVLVERTRGMGMLRAIGLTRRQTRRMVRYESVITGLIRARAGHRGSWPVLWLGHGPGGGGGVRPFSVPVGQLVAFVILAGVAGVAAAVLPRGPGLAPGTDMLEALQYE